MTVTRLSLASINFKMTFFKYSGSGAGRSSVVDRADGVRNLEVIDGRMGMVGGSSLDEVGSGIMWVDRRDMTGD
jgi:hypothetical protein